MLVRQSTRKSTAAVVTSWLSRRLACDTVIERRTRGRDITGFQCVRERVHSGDLAHDVSGASDDGIVDRLHLLDRCGRERTEQGRGRLDFGTPLRVADRRQLSSLAGVHDDDGEAVRDGYGATSTVVQSIEQRVPSARAAT